jgi:hypothetical protein
LGLLAERFVELPTNLRRHCRIACCALQGFEDHVEVVRGNPLCKELIRNAQHDRIALDATELNRLQPGFEVLSRQVRLEAAERLFPQLFHRHKTPKKRRNSPSTSPGNPHLVWDERSNRLSTNFRRRGERQLVSSL